MTDVTIYHNPRCSKSRTTLAMLEQHGVAPEIVLYLETPPNKAQIKKLLSKLGISAGELVRRGEEAYKTCGLHKGSTDAEIIAAMAEHPKLIERPIVVKGDKAVLGRPPENIEALFV